MPMPPTDAPLGLVAGGGSLPFSVAEAAIRAGRDVHIVGIRGEADQGIEAYPHTWLRWDEIGQIFGILKDAGCGEIVLVGAVGRPDPKDMKVGLGALKNVPLVISLVTTGDGNIFEQCP